MVNYIIFGVFISLISLINAQTQYCQPYTQNVLAADLPELPYKFDTRVEANFVSKNYTMDSLEIYDFFARKAAIVLYSKNVESRIIFNYPDNEIYIVDRTVGDDSEIPSSCTAKTLTDASETQLLFGFIQQNSTFITPGLPNQVLKFPTSGVFYNGTENVRGIPCEVYLSCINNNAPGPSYKLKYYFSQKNYPMPYLSSQYTQVPVRAELEGFYYTNNVRYPFKTIYDYHEFNPSPGNYAASFFRIPKGTFCINQKKLKPTPEVSGRYAYSEEIVRFKTILNLKRVYYDSLFKLVRYDVRNTQRAPETFFVLDPLTIVNDYTVGVGYHINQNLGNCTIRGLGFGAFGNDFDKNYTEQSINQGFGLSVKLKSPSSFLFLDSEYFFMGDRYENDVLVDLFISNRTEKLDGQDFSSLYEYTFRSESNGMPSSNKLRNIPVRLKVITNDITQNPQFNYFAFENDLPDYGVYDIGSCYNTDKKINFRLSFSYRGILSADDFKKGFVQFMEQFLFLVLSAELNETAMRFSPPKISIGNEGSFYAVSSILPPIPPLDLYKKWDGKWLTGTSFTTADTDSAEECAKFCNKQALCLSFDYCPSGRCYANERHLTTNGSSIVDSSCSHFSRTTDVHVPMKESKDIWTLLQNYVSLGLFFIELPIATAQGLKKINFTATGVSEIVENDRFGATNIIKRFDLAYGNSKYLKNKERYYSGLSLDQCAGNCLREGTFSCESFDYCSVSGECRLAKAGPTNVSEINIGIDNCDIYIKDPLYHYEQAPFAVSVNSKDLKIVNVNSPNQCAKECDETTKIHCRGFNYCGTSNTCYLSENHLLDNSQGSTIDLVCTHYSRAYIKDFTFSSTGPVSTIDAELTLGNTDIDFCSRACVVADGFNCKSFDYCPKSRKCLLHSNNRSQVELPSGADHVETCDNYIRDYFYATSTNVNLKYPSPKDNSENTLIGLGVTFGIAGIIGGFLLYIFLLPKLTRKQ